MPEKKLWKNCNRFSEKLGQKILQLGLNGQKLARKSDVSDSEISRIMNGKSLPGLENAIALARAVGVSLDYLADDALDADPNQPKESADELRDDDPAAGPRDRLQAGRVHPARTPGSSATTSPCTAGRGQADRQPRWPRRPGRSSRPMPAAGRANSA